MRLLLRGAALLTVGALLCSALPAQDKNAKSPSDKKERFEWSKKFDAKLTKLDGSTKEFTVQVTSGEPDPQRVQENQLYYNQRLAQISVAPVQSRQRLLAELQLDMQRRALNAMKKVTKDIDLQADDNIKVRVAQPPTEPDDKGFSKKLTKAELKKLKGPDATLPGYTADFDQLKVGQQVTVYLAKQKQAKSKTTKTEDNDMPPERAKAVMILIAADAPTK
jgi:hypothetical protein